MSLTAAQEILLAAADLVAGGHAEFSEWDLTVSAWRRNKNRFGCRGYEDDYPDHKRVMIEIMGKKKDNPVHRGWIEKTRPNQYRLSALGKAEAQRLLQTAGDVQEANRSPQAVYDAILPYIQDRVFRSHCQNPDEPRMWLSAAAFLGLTKNDPAHLDDRLRHVQGAIAATRAWMQETKKDYLRRGATGGGITIRREDLDRLDAFVKVLSERFRVQMEAIRRPPR